MGIGFIIALVTFSSWFIDLAFGQCGHLNDLSLPTLAVQTKANRVGADLDSATLQVRLLTNAGWTEWRIINNANCDDFEQGNIDYFDTFNDITDRWLAVAMYNCGTDGWIMDAFGYWDGTGMNWVHQFCGNVGGPGKSCGEDQVTGLYCGFDSTIPKYHHFIIDQDGVSCPLVVIDTTPARRRGYFVYDTDPGIPQC